MTTSSAFADPFPFDRHFERRGARVANPYPNGIPAPKGTCPARATTSTSAPGRRPGQKEDRIMTAATAEHLAPTVDLEERRARIAAQDARLEPGYYAEKFEAVEQWLTDERLSSSVEAIVDRVARRPDGSLDPERLARLTVATALHIEMQISDREALGEPCPCCA